MRKPSKKLSSINVVPYLDVMLVLLVIFMITAPLFTPGLVKPPRVGDEVQLAREVVGMLVEYDINGVITVTDPFGEQTTFTDAGDAAQQIKTECILHPDRAVAVAGDQKQFHEDVMQLFVGLKAAGCDVGFHVQQK